MPDAVEERSANTPIAVLARKRPAKPSCQRDHIIEQCRDFIAPVGLSYIEQRIYVDVRIAGVAEDHTVHFAFGERLFDSLHVIRKFGQRHRTIFDELHRGRILQAGQYRTGGVTEIPQLSLCIGRQSHVDPLCA